MSTDFYPLCMRCNLTVTLLSAVTCFTDRVFHKIFYFTFYRVNSVEIFTVHCDCISHFGKRANSLMSKVFYIFLYNLYEGQTLHTHTPSPQKINFGGNHQTRLRFGADKTRPKPRIMSKGSNLCLMLSLKENICSLDFTFISSRTSGQKLKLIRICMRNNNNNIQLQCTFVLGDYPTCIVIGINPKHEIRISSNVPCLKGAVCNGLGTKISSLDMDIFFLLGLSSRKLSLSSL